MWFIDRPSQTQPGGIWGVDVVAGGEPQFITGRLGIYSADRTLIAYPEGGQTYIERMGGERWVAPSEGRAISFSPDGTQIAWQVESSPANFDQRLIEVWVANVDGSGARRVAQLGGGGFSGWFPDGARLLISGREAPAADPFLAALTLSDGGLTPIAQSKRLRGGSISPEGGWLAYQVTFSGDPAQDGLWVARSDGSESRKLQLFGAYRWRAEGRLLVIPLETTGGSAGSRQFVEVEVSTGEMRALTDPALTPIHIAGGDWALSPDGARVAFVSADDHNIWVLGLP